ncbi:MAG TPA: hypothetical protein VGF67_08010 [Ktedonobacteraceae bacterium]
MSFHCGDLAIVIQRFEAVACASAQAAETAKSIQTLSQKAEALDYFDNACLMACDYLIRLAIFVQQHAPAFSPGSA